MPDNKCDPNSCKPALNDRPLISDEQAWQLMGLFKVLANDTRLRLLHALAKSEQLCVTELAEKVGMKPQAVSNQLQRLVDRCILSARRNGNNIYYTIIDPCVTSLLDQGLCLTEDSRERSRERYSGQSLSAGDRVVSKVSKGGKDRMGGTRGR